MYQLMQLLKNRVAIMLLVASIGIVSIVGYTVFSWVDIEHKTADLQDIYNIRDAVNTANQSIKAAAIAPDDELRKRELARRFETRKQADAAIASFDSRRHKSCVGRKFEELKNIRNGKYRASQNHVVMLIEQRVSDSFLWPEMIEYQMYQGVYVEYLNSISNSITKELNDNYRLLLKLVIGFVVMLVLLINVIITHICDDHTKEGEKA